MKQFLSILSVILIIINSSLHPYEAAAQNEAEHFSFAFMTDIHIQPEKNAEQGLMQAINHVNLLKPDFVITGGDLIMDALEQKQGRADSLYQMYLSASKQFAVPVYNTLGNHEVFGLYTSSGISPNHPLYGKKMFEKYIGKRYYSFDHKGWHFLILDGIGFTPERDYYGHIDSLQMEWIKLDLAAVDSTTPICISTHIPFVTVWTQIEYGPFATIGSGTLIENSLDVLKLFNHKNLKLVLQGHLHFLESIYTGKTTFITGGAVCSRWWEGKNDGLEEGYLMIDVKGNDFEWHYIDFGWNVK